MFLTLKCFQHSIQNNAISIFHILYNIPGGTNFDNLHEIGIRQIIKLYPIAFSLFRLDKNINFWQIKSVLPSFLLPNLLV